jgi:hypothetical protein
MTIVSSGAISINSLVGEYGGSAPHSMNEYYRGGSLVANHSNNSGVPTSGQIQLDDFYGANNTSPVPTVYSYSMTTGGSGTGNDIGFNSSSSTGSLGSNPQSTAFSSGFNPTITRWASNSSIAKDGSSSTNIFLSTSANIANSGWTSLTVPSNISSSGSAETLNRSAATYLGGSGYTFATWQWSGTSFAFNSGVTGTVSIAE